MLIKEVLMIVEDVARYLSSGRVLDLSRKVTPGGADGPLGATKRRYEIKAFTHPPGELMRYIDMESHISTHVEAPSHLFGESAHDITEVALSKFFGMAVLVDCKDFAPKTPIVPEILKRFPIQENDIVLIGRCPHGGQDRSYMVKEGAEYLLAKKIKMIGFDDSVYPENPKSILKDLKAYFTHNLISYEIPIIEMLTNLEELKSPRFLFFGFPAKMGGLEAFPIRAVAIEF